MDEMLNLESKSGPVNRTGRHLMTRIDRALMQQCILLLTLLIGLTFLPRAYAINSGNEDLKQQRQAYTKSHVWRGI